MQLKALFPSTVYLHLIAFFRKTTPYSSSIFAVFREAVFVITNQLTKTNYEKAIKWSQSIYSLLTISISKLIDNLWKFHRKSNDSK